MPRLSQGPGIWTGAVPRESESKRETEEEHLLLFPKQGHSELLEGGERHQGPWRFLSLSYLLFMGLSPFLAQVETWVLFILASLSLAQGRALGRHGGNAHESKSTQEGEGLEHSVPALLCQPREGKGDISNSDCCQHSGWKPWTGQKGDKARQSCLHVWKLRRAFPI